MIHCRLSVEKCSARCAEGNAMLTIVASSTTISCAAPSSASTAQRLGSARSSVTAIGGSAPRRLVHQDAIEASDPEPDHEPLGLDHLREERRLVEVLVEGGVHFEQLAAGLVARRGGDRGELRVALGHGEGPEMP